MERKKERKKDQPESRWGKRKTTLHSDRMEKGKEEKLRCEVGGFTRHASCVDRRTYGSDAIMGRNEKKEDSNVKTKTKKKTRQGSETVASPYQVF